MLERQARRASPSTVRKMLEVLNDKHLLPLIIVHGACNELLAYAHRMLMVEAVDTTMGGIAQEAHDEVLENILQEPHAQCLFVSYLFGKGQHQEATEMLVQQLMILNPDANRDNMLQGRRFDANGLLTDWRLSYCKIAELPESFGAVVCTGVLNLGGNELESLPLSFSNLTVGGHLHLHYNRLRCLLPNFEQIRVGGDLNLGDNKLRC